jgi:hemerythrin superfamily protein
VAQRPEGVPPADLSDDDRPRGVAHLHETRSDQPPGADAGADLDPALEVPALTPEYGGSADTGVVSSVGEHHPAAGDVVDVVLSEHRKLEGVFEELLRLADDGDLDALRARWGGVVRELLEHEAAERRVVLPAAERVAGPGAAVEVGTRQQELMDRLSPYDELNTGVAADEVRACIAAVTEHLRTVDDVVVPLLQQLPADERMRLGEDLRQVTG